jgi:hypothetical protein
MCPLLRSRHKILPWKEGIFIDIRCPPNVLSKGLSVLSMCKVLNIHYEISWKLLKLGIGRWIFYPNLGQLLAQKAIDST